MNTSLSINQKEIDEKVKFLSSVKCNHTQHMYIDITGDLIQGTLLARIMYWFAPDKNKRSKVRIFKDGYFWIAKQRRDWWDEIRITERQYDKAISELKKKGFVELAKYKFDSMPTIHIRPNYDNINAATEKWEDELRKTIIEEYEEELQKSESGNYTKCKTGITKDVTLLTEITNKDYNTDNTIISPTELNSFSKEKGKNTSPMGLNSSISKRNKKGVENNPDKWIATKTHIEICMERNGYSKESFETAEAIEVVRTYYEKYREVIGQPHPRLNDKTMMFVIEQYLKGFGEGNTSVQTYRDLIDFHFSAEYRENIDWTIQHFMSGEIREKLLYRNML